MSLLIPGFGEARISRTSEYISGVVLKEYLDNLNIVNTILDKRPPLSNSELVDSDVNNFITAVNALTRLLKEGVTDLSSSPNGQGYLDADLAARLGVVLQTLKVMGFDGNTELPTGAAATEILVNKIRDWQDLADVGVKTTLIAALNLNDKYPTRSLQSMIELEYVKQGNDIIFDKLGGLEQALRSTQDILESLAVIQGISNQIKAPAPLEFFLPPGDQSSDLDTYTARYKEAASAYFKQLPSLPNPSDTAAYDLLKAKAELSSKLTKLEEETGHLRTSANTLAFFVSKVIKDISTAFENVPFNDLSLKNAVSKWILDGNEHKLGVAGSSQAGNIQDNIAQSIKAAQSLNDTQKENVRRYMFIFEEFYKSSSIVLQKINQIIEKLAQGINR